MMVTVSMKGGLIYMRKNLQKAVGTHFGKPIWLISMTKPPKQFPNREKEIQN